jgi:1-deoxy-D-xylulose-5-phosphate reductoisomerase
MREQNNHRIKTISLLGSTGSIGQSTLRVVRHLRETFEVAALAAKSQIDLLESQAREFCPQIVAVYDKAKALELQKRIPHMRVVGGMEGLQEAASVAGADLVVSAMSGSLGIAPTLSAIQAGKTVALANKEVLVSAGEIVMGQARARGVPILPIDSEHSALFQCLDHRDPTHVRRLILTASGGPFLHYTQEKLGGVTVDEALAHPTWRMGPKVTIDCSTLMNKGLEVIEAHFLFQIPMRQIEVVVHPQSVIHSMVEMIDGSMLAQMSEPSMIVPIQYALTYPGRRPGIIPPFDFNRFSRLEFCAPDHQRFACLELCYEAGLRGGNAPCYLNAANEVLVERFVRGEIGWVDISRKLEKLLTAFSVEKELNIDKISATDTMAREQASKE